MSKPEKLHLIESYTAVSIQVSLLI